MNANQLLALLLYSLAIPTLTMRRKGRQAQEALLTCQLFCSASDCLSRPELPIRDWA